MAITVAIIEDDAPFRNAFTAILNGAPGFRCVAAWASVEEALGGLPACAPEVALVDIHLPGLSGIELVRRLPQVAPRTLAVMLTIFEDAGNLFESLKAGAHGYVLKSTPPAAILESIQDVVSGGAPVSRVMARKLIQHFHTPRPPGGDFSALSIREREVLDHLAFGLTSKEIASRLGVSADTVRAHLRSIYEKLHVHSRAGAVGKYLGHA